MSTGYDLEFGWINDPEAVVRTLEQMPRPIFAHHSEAIAGSGAGKIVLLHKAVEKVVGSFPVNNQTVGDCVSHGEAGACQVLICTDIVLRREAEEWRGLVATEPIYAGSRVEIGGGRISGDGSVGAWAARWVTEYGVLVRRKYEVAGIEFDLTEYDGDRARAWGRRGVGCPNGLEPIAKEHPVKTTSLCTGYDQARDAIANGYPVTVASNRGFNDVRDSQGFLRPSGTWSHEMYFCGVDDEFSRPGLLCINSWGKKWVSGPKRHDQPDGSFWVDADVADKMLAAGDSFAHSGFDGFPSQNLDYLLI
jgi:hypothetical protein